MAPQPATTQDLVDYLTDGYWSDSNQTTPSYPSGEITVDVAGLSEGVLAMTRLAFRSWESVANIHFHEVSGGAQIVFDDTPGGAGQGWVYVDGEKTSVVHVNLPEWVLAGTGGTSIGGTAWKTVLHEIGHALGLGHGGNYDGSASFATDALFQNDSTQLTLMSYFSTWENSYLKDSTSFTTPLTPMMADILAIQSIFGPPQGGLTAGDTTWGMGSSMGAHIDPRFQGQFAGLAGYAMTVYDESGTDTLDFSNDRFAQEVDLTAGRFSDVYDMLGNLGIAFGTVIENYRAGSAGDQVTGNGAANRLELNGGDDWARGGAGNDGILGGAGRDKLLGDEGRDRLEGGKGSDRLDGGLGNDSLAGGQGGDVFAYGVGRDTIVGFEAGRDQIRLDDALWGGREITRAEVVATFARDAGENVVLDFGDGNRLRIEGLGSLDALERVISIA